MCRSPARSAHVKPIFRRTSYSACVPDRNWIIIMCPHIRDSHSHITSDVTRHKLSCRVELTLSGLTALTTPDVLRIIPTVLLIRKIIGIQGVPKLPDDILRANSLVNLEMIFSKRKCRGINNFRVINGKKGFAHKQNFVSCVELKDNTFTFLR